jgi:hypothetical protein
MRRNPGCGLALRDFPATPNVKFCMQIAFQKASVASERIDAPAARSRKSSFFGNYVTLASEHTKLLLEGGGAIRSRGWSDSLHPDTRHWSESLQWCRNGNDHSRRMATGMIELFMAMSRSTQRASPYRQTRADGPWNCAGPHSTRRLAAVRPTPHGVGLVRHPFSSWGVGKMLPMTKNLTHMHRFVTSVSRSPHEWRP